MDQWGFENWTFFLMVSNLNLVFMSVHFVVMFEGLIFFVAIWCVFFLHNGKWKR